MQANPKPLRPFAVTSLDCGRPRTSAFYRALCAIWLAHSASISAATLTVTTAADSGPGSLRALIIQANGTTESDVITFNIPTSDVGYQSATGHWRIALASALPAVSQSLSIDGYSQPGASPNSQTPMQGGSNAVLKIELSNASGSNAFPGIDGFGNFDVTLVVRGLAINGFQSQIQLGGGTAQRVEGCFLGTSIDGLQAGTSTNAPRSGIRIQGPGAYRIGGLTPDTRNVISGDSTGIAFFTVPTGVRIEGNLIGTDASGSIALSPRADGISVGSAPGLRIGGTDPNARNVISGNGFHGIRLSDNSPGGVIQGNAIGTDWSGRRALPNGLNPFSPSQRVANVLLTGLNCAITLGGHGPGEANLIAFAGASGVQIDTCTNPVQRNRFVGNAVAAIDNVQGGGFVGPTPNDVGDADEGGNRIQNHPEVSLPVGFLPSGGVQVSLAYRVDTLPTNASYPLTVEFYRGSCGGGGSGVLLASDSYTAGSAGSLKNLLLSAPDGNNLLPLTAVAIDAVGNVSEFSPLQGDTVFHSGFETGSSAAPRGFCR